MKAEELRIGNYVEVSKNMFCEYLDCLDLDDIDKIPDNKCMQIVAVEKDQVRISLFDEEVEFYYEDLKLIPLTEQWLIDFGFNYEDVGNDNHFTKTFSKPFINIEYSINVPEFRLLYNGFHIIIKHVHQLQNIYFALTGKELTK